MYELSQLERAQPPNNLLDCPGTALVLARHHKLDPACGIARLSPALIFTHPVPPPSVVLHAPPVPSPWRWLPLPPCSSARACRCARHSRCMLRPPPVAALTQQM
eukprot:366206-Chlamydomonas_euryale.AAC.3